MPLVTRISVATAPAIAGVTSTVLLATSNSVIVPEPLRVANVISNT